MLSLNSMIKWTALKCYSAKKIIIVIITVFAVDFLYMSSKPALTLFDEYLVLFEGYGQGYFNLISLLFLLIFNGIPLYFASLTLDEQSSKVSSHVLIRQRKKSIYFLLNQIVYAVFLICYLTVHLAAVSFHGVIFGQGIKFGEYSSELISISVPSCKQPCMILAISILLRFLELLCFQSVIVLLQSITNKLSIAFILVLCGYLLLLIVPLAYYPFGLSSVMRWTVISQNIYISFIMCALIFVTALILIYIYMFKKGIYQLLER